MKGARLHNPKCMAAYGRFLWLGTHRGTDLLNDLGTRYLYQAATNVDLAAYTIGTAVLTADFLLEDFEKGKKLVAGAVPIKWFSKANLDEAKYWLKKVVHRECEHKILGIADMLDAQEKLEEIEEHEKAKQQ